MRGWLNQDAITGALYLALGLLVVFVLIPLGVDEPGNVEFAALAPAYWPRIIARAAREAWAVGCRIDASPSTKSRWTASTTWKVTTTDPGTPPPRVRSSITAAPAIAAWIQARC